MATDINQFTDEDLSGVGIGPEHGVAKTRLNEMITKGNSVDTRLEAMEVAAAIVGLDLVTDEDEQSAALSGLVANQFVPTHVVVVITAKDGTVAADATLNVGITSDGDEILSGVALTGLDAANKARVIPIAAGTFDILANATLYANVESADSTATTLAADVHIIGRQFTPSS